MADLRSQYEAERSSLEGALGEILEQVRECVGGRRYVAAVMGRVKDAAAFTEKAAKTDERGLPRYPAPLRDIQDQIGCRIVVRSPSSVRDAARRLAARFGKIQNERRPPNRDAGYFGYDARHVMCLIPLGVRRRHRTTVEWFEVQVATLFQFAWAEMEHDLGYKGKARLTYDQRRIISSAAAISYAADRLFISAKRLRTPRHALRANNK